VALLDRRRTPEPPDDLSGLRADVDALQALRREQIREKTAALRARVRRGREESAELDRRTTGGPASTAVCHAHTPGTATHPG